MRRVVLGCAIVSATGCNPFFDLTPTELAPPIAIDAAPDARPPSCPPAGTELRASKELVQIVRHDCLMYSVSGATQVAVASCTSTTRAGYQLHEGRVDHAMAPIGPSELTSLDIVRLAPEGNEIFVRGYIAGVRQLLTYRRGADGRWTPGPPPNFVVGANEYFSSVTRRPDRRVLIGAVGGPYVEWIQDEAGSWTQGESYSASDLACPSVYLPMLTADGLRMVMGCYPDDAAEFRFHVADRATRDARFNPAVPLDGAPTGVYFYYLTEDCSRLYFSALDSVFYMRIE